MSTGIVSIPCDVEASSAAVTNTPSFVDTDETYHFFNDAIVWSTNEIRNTEEAEPSDCIGNTSRRRRSSSVASIRRRRRSRTHSRASSGMGDDDDEFDDDYDDEEINDAAGDGTSASKANDGYASEDMSDDDEQDHVYVGSVKIPEPPPSYETIFDPFFDLYMPIGSSMGQNGALQPSAAEIVNYTKKQEQQGRRARRALATFTQRALTARSYKYRKQSEFLRVCYLRALESAPEKEPPTSATIASDSNYSTANSSSVGIDSKKEKTVPLLTVHRKDDVSVETTVPTLHPRKWPHLPFRHPLEWEDNVDDAVDFMLKLATLPESSLLYEPVDVQGFVDEVGALLKKMGMSVDVIPGSRQKKDEAVELSEEAVAGLLALFGLGVQLQSFSLLSYTALLFVTHGQKTFLQRDRFRPQLKDVLDLYWWRLEKHASEPVVGATYSRALLAQWKINSYQPSTSDAIATDGLYLYIYGRTGLLKIGTGNGPTVRDFVYMHNKDYTRSRDAERSWLCCIGEYLYCRTIITPGHRVDRIPTNDLSVVDELFFGPNRSLFGKSVSESSVYAMITDGTDLYTIRCIDTHKRTLHGKHLSRRHKHHHPRIKKIPLKDILRSDRPGSIYNSVHSNEENAIKVGDRVVRGPDWKWSNQDGEPGSLGTVERISTWGNVNGSGVTVRWDKNFRVNTYRWGAEGCYDLVIVVEQNGQIVERKPLPSRSSNKDETKNGDKEEEPPPRHQFVLYRHDVSRLASIMDLEDDEINLFLDLTPSRFRGEETAGATKENIKQDSIRSTLHSHTLSLCKTKTSAWMCDGGMSDCLGDNAEKRYRCDSGCDYDLCEMCLLSTLIVKKDKTEIKDIPPQEAATENVQSEDTSRQEELNSVISVGQEKDEAIESIAVAPSTTLEDAISVDLETNPFAIFHSSLFCENDGTNHSFAKDKRKEALESERKLVDELTSLWCGLYTRRECQVSLRRNGFSLNEASLWLHHCASELREKMLVPTLSGVPLTAKANTRALDPVLLIAGTFYATRGQLCIVSPPGLYTVRENQSDRMKRAANACDAAWFFSMETGIAISSRKDSAPILLKGIPAGSPCCVDARRKRILVVSGYLNCLEEYIDPVSVENFTSGPKSGYNERALAHVGNLIFSRLNRLVSHRWALPAYKHPRAGLQDILFRTEREPSDKQNAGDDMDGNASKKSKARRIKNIRGRLKELERLEHADPPGYFIPFCVDFQDGGLLTLIRALSFSYDKIRNSNVDHLDLNEYRLISSILRILNEITKEFDSAGIAINIDEQETKTLFAAAESILYDLAHGCLFDIFIGNNVDEIMHLRSNIALWAQSIIVWGIRKRLFFSDHRSDFLGATCEKILKNVSSPCGKLPDWYFSIMLDSRESLFLTKREECDAACLRNLLYSSMDTGRLGLADFVSMDTEKLSRLLNLLFDLSQCEYATAPVTMRKYSVRSPYFTPVSKALHTMMNYCSARLYDMIEGSPINQEAVPAELNPVEVFELFANACINSVIKLLQQHVLSGTQETVDVDRLRSSAMGTILPLVIGTISNFPARFTEKLRDKLFEVLHKVDSCMTPNYKHCSNHLIAQNLEKRSDFCASFIDGDQVVESPHPYNQTQPAFRRVIRIPGASSIHIDFDSRCQTSGEADFVFVTSGHAWFHSDRIAFGESGIGENGGCFFGSPEHGNWPAKGLTVLGDTITIMLCVTTQSREAADADERKRWGVKVSVRGLFLSPDKPWLLEIGCGIANACSLIGEQLIRGTLDYTVQEEWIERYDIFDCTNPRYAVEPKIWEFLDEVVENRGRGTQFLMNVAKWTRSPKVMFGNIDPLWKVSQPVVVAAFAALSDPSLLISWIDNSGHSTATSEDNDNSRLFEPIASEITKLEQWMLRQVQLMKEWNYLRVDNVQLDDLIERYADNSDRLAEFCQLQNVPFKKTDVVSCITTLHSLLSSEAITLDSEKGSNLAQPSVSESVVEKARFILDRWKAASKSMCSTSSAVVDVWSRSTVDHTSTSLGEFLRCRSTISALNHSSQVHSARLTKRMSGFAFCERVLSTISTKELQKYFVGRGLVSLPRSSIVDEGGILSECYLADPSLLMTMLNRVNNYGDLMRSLVADESEHLFVRSLALAEVCNLEYSNPNALSRVASLQRAADLILGIDNSWLEVVAGSANGRRIVYHLYDVVWIAFRRLLQEIFGDYALYASEAKHAGAFRKVFEVCLRLYDHFMGKQRTCTSSSLYTSGDIVQIDSDIPLYRLLCAQAETLDILYAWKDDLIIWIQRAIELVISSDIPLNLSIAAVRLLRKIVELHGDSTYDIQIRINNGVQIEGVTIGKDIQRILLERVGNLVSLHPPVLEHGNTQETVTDSDEYAVVIFQNDMAHEKMTEAVDKIGEPDITALNIPVYEGSAMEYVKVGEADESTIIHRGVRCDGCNQSPLRGFRFKCFTCPNYDLCTTCYMNQTHNTDHEFVRLTDSTGVGDLMQARSKGGGTVPETSLVGSKQWKGSLLRVLLSVKGYAVYHRGVRKTCIETATELSELGFLATVVDNEELRNLDEIYHWEGQALVALEPGSARLNRRSISSQKSFPQKADPAVINVLNRNACMVNSKSQWYRRKIMEDSSTLASEIIALLRLPLSNRYALSQWRNSTLKTLRNILEEAPEYLDCNQLEITEHRKIYYLVMGATNVLGGFRESFRTGGSVVRKNANKIDGGGYGMIYSFAIGNENVTLFVSHAASREPVEEMVRINITVSEIEPTSEIVVDEGAIRALEYLVPAFCSSANKIYSWMKEKGDEEQELSTESLLRSELACSLMQSFAFMAPMWPSLFDTQTISTNGNIPMLLFSLAQKCMKDLKLEEIQKDRLIAWQMERIRSQCLHYALATRPISGSTFGRQDEKACIIRPPASTDEYLGGESPSSEQYYNMYAFSSRADLPQHSGRNKLLEYWEKNVIPAIETYVAGSFKSYEMDYFFAQLREPLREGNSAAALKIAFTLCDGHVPSGCHYPDPDTDWSALQVDDVEVGGRYLVSADNLDTGGWPHDMLWTVGHSGVVRMVTPSGMILMQVMKPMSSRAEYWWYHVDYLKVSPVIESVSEHSVTDIDRSKTKLYKLNKHLICCTARKSVFDLLQVAPDHLMMFSIDRTAIESQEYGHLRNRYNLADLLKLAAAADLGCPENAICSEIGNPRDSSNLDTAGGMYYVRNGISSASSLILILQKVLHRQFERTTGWPQQTWRSRDEATPLMKTTKKLSKHVKAAEKLSSTNSLKSGQGKLKVPESEPEFSAVKYRYMLMESLLKELKASLDASSSFSQRNSFTVASDSPPKPLVLVHVPDTTCLILSFVVHPVLMDLPPGSSLEVFRDKRCTDRIFGYFGEKRGLNYLPPLVVPGDRCYIRLSQGAYARYKFRVNGLTSDFGLALWIGEELYQKLITVSFSGYEVETLLSNLMNAVVDYLVSTPCLPPTAKNAVIQLLTKLINFALGKGVLNGVPVAKLSSLVKELSLVYDNERSTQQSLFSLYTQQLAELISLVEEVLLVKGGSSQIVSGSWWTEFVRMATFTRALVTGKRESSIPEPYKKIYCGRSPLREVEIAHQMLSTRDLFCERLLLLQKIPQTNRIADLQATLSRFIIHLSLEECGEADDQSAYSASEVTRFGIISKVLYLPVDNYGFTKGFAILDVGREDITTRLITRLAKEKFEFEGDSTAEDADLMGRVSALRRPSCDSQLSGSKDVPSPNQDDHVWSCIVCTLENSMTETECAACGSPIPPELAELARQQLSISNNGTAETNAATSSEEIASNGWACSACTFVNNWADSHCLTCALVRSPDLVLPSPPSDQNDDNAMEKAGNNGIESNSYHYLSAVRLVDALLVAEEVETPQVSDFLRHRLLNDKGQLSTAFRDVLKKESARYKTSTESKKTIDSLASLVDATANFDCLPSDEQLDRLAVDAARVVDTKPLSIYKWMRAVGYDLQLDLNHYPSLEAALAAQVKWTHQMDCQLIAICKNLSSSIGVLTLLDLCPSHINATKHAVDQPLLASLETRDLRFRFAVLKTFNQLLLASLPLVNLRPSSDPSSLRSRIISIRQLIFPGVKIRFFAQTQDNTSLACSNFVDTSTKRPMVTLDRRKIFGRRAADSVISLINPSKSLFALTMNQLSAIKPSQLRAKRPTGASDPFVSFIVIFAGENVVGEGGPYRQLFNDIANELLSPGNILFIPTQNNIMKVGEYRERFTPRPSSTSKELLQMYEFVGVLMGCCLRTGVRLNIRLAPIVWKMLVKQSLVFSDLESVDWSLCESLKYLETLAADGSTPSTEILYDSFTSTLSDGTILELKPNGHRIPVTKENCKEYIRLVKASRLQECKPQVDAMLRGIGKIVPVHLLQLCVWSELQQWVCGSLDINIELLKRHTRYSSGMNPEKFPHLDMFWRVLASFSEENKRRFINFAWGQDTLPADDAEFDRTHTRLLIKASASTTQNQDALLPKSDTCFFNIELPAYSTEEIMREKLLLAITMCTSLDGDEQTGRMDIYYAGDEVDDDRIE